VRSSLTRHHAKAVSLSFRHGVCKVPSTTGRRFRPGRSSLRPGHSTTRLPWTSWPSLRTPGCTAGRPRQRRGLRNRACCHSRRRQLRRTGGAVTQPLVRQGAASLPLGCPESLSMAPVRHADRSWPRSTFTRVWLTRIPGRRQDCCHDGDLYLGTIGRHVRISAQAW
jgi:hypothetical protein